MIDPTVPDAIDRRAEAAAGDLVAGMLDQVRQRAWVLALSALVGSALAVGLKIAAPREWTARFSFAPQARRTPGGAGLSSLAAQFGVNVPGAEPSQSPQFYQQLITGQTALEALVDSVVPSDSGPVRLANTIAEPVQGTDSLLLRERAVRELRKRLLVSVDNKTGIVAVQVRMPSPAMATRTGELLLTHLDEFNVDTRRSQAKAERVFTEERAKASSSALRKAEGALQAFLTQNRDYRNAPALLFEYDRLNRELQLRQAVQSSLAQSLEQSRIDEVRDTPSITIVERPRLPVVPDSRGLPQRFIAGGILGALVGFLASEALRLSRRGRTT